MASEDVPRGEHPEGAADPARESGQRDEASLPPEWVANNSGQTSGDETGRAGAADGAGRADDGAEPAQRQAPPAASPGAGPVLGALGVVSVGLGVVSLTGMTLAGMLRDRVQINAQIHATLGGSAENPIQSLYNAPWHQTALVNGAVGVVAAVLGAVVLILAVPRVAAGRWHQPVALAGVVLGVLGIVIAAGMYTGAFAPAPQIPSSPAPGVGAPGGG
jgi:hypothetical protein